MGLLDLKNLSSIQIFNTLLAKCSKKFMLNFFDLKKYLPID